MITKWQNVKGEVVIELNYSMDGTVYDCETDELVCEALQKLLAPLENAYLLVVEFTSTGYYDSGSMYGGWQNLGSPPEGDDERTITRVYYRDCDNQEHELRLDILQGSVMDELQRRVEDADVDYEEYAE